MSKKNKTNKPEEVTTTTTVEAPRAQTTQVEDRSDTPSEVLFRAAVIDQIERTSDPDNRVLSLSFSSEQPVERSYGMEVLSHDAGAVDLQRLNAAGPLLLDHKNDQQIGVVTKAWVGTDKKGRATVKFSKGQLGTEIWNDIQDGVRKNVSVGYQVLGKPEVSGNTYRWNKWVPSHVAIVSEPADITVGINRSKETSNEIVADLNTPTKTTNSNKGVLKSMSEVAVINKEEVLTAERNRVNEIRSAAKKFTTDADIQKLAEESIERGVEVSKFLSDVFTVLSSKKDEVKKSPANIGLTATEARKFSITKMVRYLADPNNKQHREDAAFEIEASNAARDKVGGQSRGANSFILPMEVTSTRQSRAISASSAGDLIQTDVLMGSFIDVLRNACQVSNLGATHLDNLVGNVQIPRMSAASTAHWLTSDTGSLTESDATFDDITFTPHTLTGYSKVTRQALAQVSGLDAIITNDLARSSGVALDAACINGTGTGVPTGILNLGSIPTVSLGANGAAPTYAAVTQMIGKLAAANALFGQLAFLTNSNVFETLTSTLKDSSNTASNYILGGVNGDLSKLAGYTFAMSNNVPNNLTKSAGSNLSAMIFGNWTDAVIASWGTQEILVDVYTGAASNQVYIYNFGQYDFNVRHLGSFSVIVDMVTT